MRTIDSLSDPELARLAKLSIPRYKLFIEDEEVIVDQELHGLFSAVDEEAMDCRKRIYACLRTIIDSMIVKEGGEFSGDGVYFNDEFPDIDYYDFTKDNREV